MQFGPQEITGGYSTAIVKSPPVCVWPTLKNFQNITWLYPTVKGKLTFDPKHPEIRTRLMHNFITLLPTPPV